MAEGSAAGGPGDGGPRGEWPAEGGGVPLVLGGPFAETYLQVLVRLSERRVGTRLPRLEEPIEGSLPGWDEAEAVPLAGGRRGPLPKYTTRAAFAAPGATAHRNVCVLAITSSLGVEEARRDGLVGFFVDCGGGPGCDGPPDANNPAGSLYDQDVFWHDGEGEELLHPARWEQPNGVLDGRVEGRLEQLALEAWQGRAPVRGPERFLRPRSGMARWRGRIAVVTGASAGIGKCVATALALQGMTVVACARRRGRLEALQEEVAALGAPRSRILPLELDVSDAGAAAGLRDRIRAGLPETSGCFEVLVNNAGLGRDDASLTRGSTEAWAEMLNTNVLAVAVLQREAVEALRASGREGHVVNISSLSGHRVPNRRPPLGFYAATKHAVRAMTEGLRQELAAEGIPCRASAISPGLVRTEFYAALHGGDSAKGESTYRGLGFESLAPEDVAETVLQHVGAPRRVLVADSLLRPAGQRD